MPDEGGNFKVKVDSLVYGGNGMGRLPDGRAVFVPFVLPAEEVNLQIVDSRQRFARADLIEVLTPSSSRIKPRCQHYMVCGGCHYQHLEYQDQEKIKTQILFEQCERIAGINDPPIREMISSPRSWYYRNTVQFHLNRDGKLGYKAAGSNEIVTIKECHLPVKEIMDIWALLEFQDSPNLERVELVQGSGDDLLLVLRGDDFSLPEFELDLPVSAVHLSATGQVILAGNDYVIMEVNERTFSVSAGSFFQVNNAMAGQLVDHVLENLSLSKDMTVLDVYCGVGLFSAFLAPFVKRCIGVEASPSACQDYAVNLDEFENVELFEGRAEKILPHIIVSPDIILVDPPRAGLDRKVLDAIVQLRPDTLVYISCDPATLARDMKRLLKAG
ncbi:MAG: class I SAM-dependent RNA methyltransferase, partial [Anaerolineaceae bacterium]|nr:class I SAM-dependent RNA methyltransferase [Anaerolineaceae bacterium]